MNKIDDLIHDYNVNKNRAAVTRARSERLAKEVALLDLEGYKFFLIYQDIIEDIRWELFLVSLHMSPGKYLKLLESFEVELS